MKIVPSWLRAIHSPAVQYSMKLQFILLGARYCCESEKRRDAIDPPQRTISQGTLLQHQPYQVQGTNFLPATAAREISIRP